MSRFLDLAHEERAEYIREAAARLSLLPIIVEKDFWVCWTLDRVFSLSGAASQFVFKGGTSLSKVFRAIERFSEDIDLGIAPAQLGWKDSDLDDAPNPTQRQKRMKELEADCANWVENSFLPLLEKEVRANMRSMKNDSNWLKFTLDPLTHSPVVNFMYPSVLAPEAGYIAPLVKLEFGSLTDQMPRGPHAIKPLLAEVIHEPFLDFTSQVIALEVERTFWEKATILHAEHHRPDSSRMRDRYARHYSDFAALWKHPSRTKALERLDILARVVTHKKRFFGSAWSSYETARPGGLKLVPKPARMKELEKDYGKMELMFASQPISFNDMIACIAEAERVINQL